MEKLPNDVKVNIFSRLPAESILQYKQFCVCKSWLSLFSDPSFAQIHIRRQLFMLNNHDDTTGGVEFGLILLSDFDLRHAELLYRKYDENDEQSYKIVKKINHPFININSDIGGSKMVGSCNGLICLATPIRNVLDDPTNIFNPITREYVKLPRLFGGKSCSRYCHIMNGFGYHPSTNEYKVVRIFYSDSKEKTLGQVQVYTLGAGSGWRDKGQVPNAFRSEYYCTATLANGKLHWLDREENIVAFDLAGEEFHIIASPPIVYLDGERDKHVFYSRRLCVLSGWLGLAHYIVRGSSSHVDIWLLKKKSITGYDMNEQEQQCWGWSKEFTIPTDDDISLLALTKRGEVLFWQDFKFYICRYDSKSTTIEKLVSCEPRDGNELGFTEAIPHVNSFVSLKSLGEKCKRRLKYYMRK